MDADKDTDTVSYSYGYSFIINIKAEDFCKHIAGDFRKKSLIHQIMRSRDHCLQETMKKI